MDTVCFDDDDDDDDDNSDDVSCAVQGALGTDLET